ncbi:hypothetical protein [Burkholderia gladioli]|uniref:hypothetical protein n=1 Tax=Burkholderia gladioli TaxID=28095 RepID=UPI00163F16BF|nr:hypothetical protein [Burkholderia gladioli]
MNDRELLELAAKAAGKPDLVFNEGRTNAYYAGSLIYMTGKTSHQPWNPLNDDGDALRLAVKLRLDIEHGSELDNDRYVYVSRNGIELVRDAVGCWEDIEEETHRADATRHAITRAAAEIERARITTEDGK